MDYLGCGCGVSDDILSLELVPTASCSARLKRASSATLGARAASACTLERMSITYMMTVIYSLLLL